MHGTYPESETQSRDLRDKEDDEEYEDIQIASGGDGDSVRSDEQPSNEFREFEQ